MAIPVPIALSLPGAQSPWQSRTLPRPKILSILFIHVEFDSAAPVGKGAGGEGRTLD